MVRAMTYTPQPLDRVSGIPLWRQIASDIRAALDEGDLKPGDEIPSEPALAQTLGVTRDVVRKALNQLKGEGLIIRRPGAPSRVTQPAKVRQVDARRYRRELALLTADADHPDSSAFTEEHGIAWAEYAARTPAPEIFKDKANEKDAEWLGMPLKSPVLRRHFIKHDENGPAQLQRSTMPWEIAGGTAIADPKNHPWRGGTIAELWSLGWRVTGVVEEAGSRMPTEDERRKLQQIVPGPVLSVVRIFLAEPIDGEEERPIEISRVIAPAASNVLRYETRL